VLIVFLNIRSHGRDGKRERRARRSDRFRSKFLTTQELGER